MSAGIQGSVGLDGGNARSDTIAVQTLLTRAGMQLGLIDGRCGPKTISAIIHYQRGFLRTPDGLVEPDATTWRHLTGGGGASASAAPTPIRRVTPVRTPTRVGLAQAAAAAVAAPRVPAQAAAPTPAPNSSSSFLTKLPRPPRTSLNKGLHSPGNTLLLGKYGAPRQNYSQNDQPITNEKLKRMMTTEHVGPFKVTGMAPAVASLRQVFADVQAQMPTLYNALGTAGMKCVRYQRNSTTKISNHSWGTAIDLTLNGKLDGRGDNKVYHGLVLLAPFFNARGWYWGAGFSTEDAMHFECSTSLIASFPSA
ncbi:M15 family metallopeptidase [Sphingomonas sp. S2-65]|uniref:M15 family metallopeptidase n=1 Tax=Sphingomonas sp. S2-65 TaxID=2903960 RepID=UPI001F2F13DB|nr:M15 family metallopeptidase [Sphingomonas sp. S2-65]UYY57222.1 M15 family metallopeptidase [Sphingomonas sp. S2-65]